MGVFAIIPAYDRFFRDSFSDIAGNKCGFNTLNKKSLEIIYQFYIENKEEIEKLPNGVERVGIYAEHDIETYRDLIHYISATTASFATIDRLVS